MQYAILKNDGEEWEAVSAEELRRILGELESPAEFPIGTKYKTRGKAPHVCTVVDVLRTYDNEGKMTSLRYVATHQFMGQVITDANVVSTSIKMGLQN